MRAMSLSISEWRTRNSGPSIAPFAPRASAAFSNERSTGHRLTASWARSLKIVGCNLRSGLVVHCRRTLRNVLERSYVAAIGPKRFLESVGNQVSRWLSPAPSTRRMKLCFSRISYLVGAFQCGYTSFREGSGDKSNDAHQQA